MEITKFLNVIADIINEEEDNDITQILNELHSSLANVSPEQETKIEENVNKLKEIFKQSVINSYPPSNIRIVNKIDGVKYCSNNAYKQIKSMLSSSYNPPQTAQKLQTYTNKRNDFLNTIKPLRENLEKLNIEPHFYLDETYEIGIIIPTEITNDEIPELIKNLKSWNKFLKDVNEITTGKTENPKISLVSSSSLEFFFESPFVSAYLTVKVIEGITSIYRQIIQTKKIKLELKKMRMDKPINEIKKEEKKRIEKNIRALAEHIVKEHAHDKLTTERKNELMNSMHANIKYISKVSQDGLIIEITPPEIEKPEILNEEETKENKKERQIKEKKYNKMLTNTEMILNGAKAIKELTISAKNVQSLLTNGDPDDQEDEVVDEEKVNDDMSSDNDKNAPEAELT